MSIKSKIEALRITFNPVTVNNFSEIGRVANNQAIDDVLEKLNPYFEEKDKPDLESNGEWWWHKHDGELQIYKLYQDVYGKIMFPEGTKHKGKWIKAIVPEVAQPVS